MDRLKAALSNLAGIGVYSSGTILALSFSVLMIASFFSHIYHCIDSDSYGWLIIGVILPPAGLLNGLLAFFDSGMCH